MEDITIGQILGWIGLIVGAYELIKKTLGILDSPFEKLREEEKKDMKKMNEIIAELQENKADKKDVEALEKQMNLTLKIQLSLLEHAITGNHINNLEELKKEAQEFLINN